jgi:hypothetical protein
MRVENQAEKTQVYAQKPRLKMPFKNSISCSLLADFFLFLYSIEGFFVYNNVVGLFVFLNGFSSLLWQLWSMYNTKTAKMVWFCVCVLMIGFIEWLFSFWVVDVCFLMCTLSV